MAGEIGALGVKFLYAAETSVGVRPTTGYAAKATGATLDLADYIVEATGFGAEIETADVTPMSTPQYGRRRFIPLLYGNDGNIKTRLFVDKECPVEDITNGNFKIKELKKLPDEERAEIEGSGDTSFMEVPASDSGELPF